MSNQQYTDVRPCLRNKDALRRQIKCAKRKNARVEPKRLRDLNSPSEITT